MYEYTFTLPSDLYVTKMIRSDNSHEKIDRMRQKREKERVGSMLFHTKHQNRLIATIPNVITVLVFIRYLNFDFKI